MEFIKNNRQKGFLLIDALVAMLILTVALLAISSTVISSSKLSRTNDEQTEAYKFAQKSMEKLKEVQSSEWKTLVPKSQATYIEIEPIINSTLTLPTTDADRKYTSTYSAKMITAANTGEHLIQVRLEVEWTSNIQAGAGQVNQIELLNYFERDKDPQP